MEIKRISILSGRVCTMDLDVTQEQLERLEIRKTRKLSKEEWVEKLEEWPKPGESIRDIFPDLTPAEREFLLSGISPQEWNETFGERELDCRGRSVDVVIKELAELPSHMYVCLLHWNGNEYVRVTAEHLREIQHLQSQG